MNPIANATQWNRIGLEVNSFIFICVLKVYYGPIWELDNFLSNTHYRIFSRLAGASLSACQGACKGSSVIMYV